MTDSTPDSHVLSTVERAFENVLRPDHFTDFMHCEECAEHEQTLNSCTPETIGMDELGNPGWDPICFITIPGFHYYMPGLARLAFARENFYLGQFLFHLDNERIASFSAAQRNAVRDFLKFVRDRALDELGCGIESNDFLNEGTEIEILERRIRRLKS